MKINHLDFVLLKGSRSSRKYKCGAEKRKLQFGREKERNKCAFFFKSEDINVIEIAINPLKTFNVVNKKVRSPGLDIGEGNKLIVSLKEFVKNIRQQSDQKLKEYEEKAKKLSTSVGTDYSDINKRRITSKFSYKSTDKVSVNGEEKFKRDTLNIALDKVIMDLNKRSDMSEEDMRPIAKSLIFGTKVPYGRLGADRDFAVRPN
ncbi:hypothetical protein evm_013351 [Chilo suppressalis]|nr:hypothetical protein evm_013351 [Chilo suppressalis]